MLKKNGQYVRGFEESEGDKGLRVEFYHCPTDDLDHVKILIPGDKYFRPDFVATEEYQERFAAQWDAFKNERDQLEGQTPLTEVTFIDDAMASGSTPPSCVARPGTVGRNAGSTTPDVLL